MKQLARKLLILYICSSLVIGKASALMQDLALETPLTIEQKASQEYAQKLFQQIDSRNNQNVSQTEAILRVPKMREQLLAVPNLNLYGNIIESVLTHGNNAATSAYEFFHAQHWIWQLYQDTFTKLYLATQKIDSGTLKDFYFLRYALNDTYYNDYKDATAFLDWQLKKYGMVDDMTAVAGHLLSTNLALFANINYEGESTWEYFTSSKSWTEPNRDMMLDIMKTFSFAPTFVDEILALAPLLETKEGRLFQILIPKSLVDFVAYTAWTRGIPYDTTLIKDIVTRRDVKEGTRPKIKEIVETYQAAYKNQEPFAVEMVKNLRDAAAAGKYYPSAYLDQYQKNPEKISFFDTMQARLLITTEDF